MVSHKILSLDIETFSDIDLIKGGVYAYVDSLNFEILLMAYSFDDGETKIIDIAQGEKIPNEIVDTLYDESIIKTAFNANFERRCLSKHFNTHLKADSWQCSAVQSSMLALPLSLQGVGEVLGLKDKKLKEGKDLIRYFCMPCKPTKANGGRTRNLPTDDPEKWEMFKTYCIRDVDVEKSIRKKLIKFPISDKEMEYCKLDQEINDRGIKVDMDLVRQAITCDLLHKDIVTKMAYELTGLENPNSVSQLKSWLEEKKIEIDSLSKQTVKDLIKETDGEVTEMLKLRQLMSKTSVKKYEAVERSICKDGRVHGLLQFYGANRTGRWAGRLIQVQNLPQNHISDIELARSLVKQGRFEDIEILYGNTPNILSELIRTAFVPKDGCQFIVADFSAIEARVLAWLSGEKWRLDVFASHGKIYEASASAMFHVPMDEITKGSPLRQKGKVSELACGYGGGVGALKSMGAVEMGVDESELQGLINNWRNANPNITKFWWEIDAAALKVVKERKSTVIGKIKINYESGIMFITLPSGRKLSYIKPRIELNKFGRDGITYEGIGTARKWERIETYGPKLVENIVQAASRDLLAESMLSLTNKGFNIVMHIHDEVVLEVPIGFSSIKEVCDIMAEQPGWALGLPLRADGYQCSFYRKD